MKKIGLVILFLGISIAFGAFYFLFAKNNRTADDKIQYINIPTGASYSDVVALLNEKKIIADFSTFDFVAKLKKYPAHVKAGHYVFTKKMTNRQMVNMLRAGLQKPVKFVIYNIRTNEELAGLASRTLEIDSVGFLRTITSEKLLKEWNTDAENVKGKFIVANYEMYWNTSIEKLLTQMHKSYNTFWNESRLAKAKALGYSPDQITTLAAIVQKECIFDRELKTVAGVYHNRLAIAMPLQADPTLVYATRDFDARRITNFHKAVESPYNTYKYAGLPPGPICIPNPKAIDATLNPEKHNYFYFCANPDLSGNTIFSTTLQEQNSVAAAYRAKMNELKIK
jgi:UPF0755 protein